MEIKLFEIRDDCTFVPAMAILLEGKEEAERYLLSRVGYGQTVYEQRQFVLLHPMHRTEIRYDPHQWGDRTFFTAHQFIRDNWNILESGCVVDVSFILGERAEPRKSERIEYG